MMGEGVIQFVRQKEAIKAGRTVEAVWPDKPAKAAQKDMDARWTVKFAKAHTAANSKPHVDIAIPSFGFKNHIAIDRASALSANRWSLTVPSDNYDERFSVD